MHVNLDRKIRNLFTYKENRDITIKMISLK